MNSNLSENLYVSDLTITKDLAKLRSELKAHNLYIKTKNDSFFIVGDEKDKHKYLMNLLNQEWQSSKFDSSSIQQFFEIANIQEIRNIITEALKNKNFHLDDFSMLNYILHIAICIETSPKSPKKDIVFNELDIIYEFSPHFLGLLSIIYDKLKIAYPTCDFAKKQIAEASILMSTRAISSKINTITEEDLKSYAGEEVTELTNILIQSLYSNYGIQIAKNDFFIRFTLHLKNLIKRARGGIQIPVNPLVSIKDDYPFLYMIASYVSIIISNYIGKELPESETTYIALHLGVLIQENEIIKKNLSCIIIVYDYLDLGNQIFNKIASTVDNLYLKNIISSYDDIEVTDDIDLIITTLPAKTTLDIYQIEIRSFPTKQDIQNISEQVEVILQNRKEKKLIINFNRLFNKDFFYTDIHFASYNDCISFLCKELEEKSYVDHEFINGVLEHEKIMSTEYSNVAIPHPLVNTGNHINESTIAVLINKTPITWLHNSINFVFMLALIAEDYPLFSDIFSIVISSLNNITISEKLLECKSLEEFISILLSSVHKKID